MQYKYKTVLKIVGLFNGDNIFMKYVYISWDHSECKGAGTDVEILSIQLGIYFIPGPKIVDS
jgi:hypothetical protein